MGVKEQIRDLDEYPSQQPQQGQKAQQGQQGQRRTQSRRSTGPAASVGDALGPVLDWEKTDVEFWMQVAQVILLYLILRELRRGGP